MAGTPSDESGIGRTLDGILGVQQRCQSGEALAEWRSSEQVENGIPSTSPPYWDTDDDDDYGPKPSELYGKYTWKIDKFSQINKRELRSNAFEVGGYKWYILIYPQGCDVCNHLSLFLCVANHDKLLPGWSHFAQFTIAVVNKDPKKTKYSDTLHRFWKKEHDWGWKKFMELSKVLDGFIDADTLIIKAQVQVIRERADRPFRCLDCQYRRELVRVYLTNVETHCINFIDDRRGKLKKLIEDEAKWPSFRAFWLGIDQNARRRMSREKTDAILKVVVKQFFIEKEVTSTLVMDSLYSGLKALEGQTKSKKGRGILLDADELLVPIIRVEKDMFVLEDDVLLLLERTAMEASPQKDDKGPQNRMKDGGSGDDFNKDSIEREERRLTELGRKTIEIFVLAHIFSNIEVAYQEAVALKRQEELIREEEAAWLAETGQKSKRVAAEKEKKAKKKQGKQKRNNRKGKDKGREGRPDVAVSDKFLQENAADEREDFMTEEAESVHEKPDTLDDVSDVSDSVDCRPEILQADSEDREASPVNWDTDVSEVLPPTEASCSGVSGLSSVQNETRERINSAVVDDSSSTCSTDSVPSVVLNGPSKGNSLPNQKPQKSPSRGRNQRSRVSVDATAWAGETHCQPSEATTDVAQANDACGSCKAEFESEAVVHSLQDRIKELEKHVVRKEEEVVSLRRELSVKDQADAERPSKEMTAGVPSSPRSPSKNLLSVAQVKTESKTAGATDPVSVKKPSGSTQQAERAPNLPSSVQVKSEAKTAGATDPISAKKPLDRSQQAERTAPPMNSADTTATLRSDSHKAVAPPKPTERPLVSQVPTMSRPLSAPIIPGLRPPAPVVSMVQTAPLLARSVSAAGRLGPDPSPATHSYVPQSYRNAIMGTAAAAAATSSTGFAQPPCPSSGLNPSQSYPQPPNLMSSPMFLPQSSEKMEPNMVKPGVSFGMVNHDVLQNGPQWMDLPQWDSSRHYDPSTLRDDIHNHDFYKPVASSRSHDRFSTEFPASSSGCQTHGVLTDEFPHLDIINDLLDDEHGYAKVARASTRSFQSFGNGPSHHLNRQFTFPGDIGISNDVRPSPSSCKFERTRSYHDDGFQQRGYDSFGGQFDLVQDMNIPQANPQSYVNGQIDGLIPPNQWQMAGSDLSLLGMRNVEGDGGYPYHMHTDYSNLACGVNGYTVFRPSNGH